MAQRLERPTSMETPTSLPPVTAADLEFVFLRTVHLKPQ
jgi:hypothetical protein